LDKRAEQLELLGRRTQDVKLGRGADGEWLGLIAGRSKPDVFVEIVVLLPLDDRAGSTAPVNAAMVNIKPRVSTNSPNGSVAQPRSLTCRIDFGT
jgi:hypothetical protein